MWTGSQGASSVLHIQHPAKTFEGNHLTPTETPTGSSLDVQDETVAQSATESSLESHDHDHEVMTTT